MVGGTGVRGFAQAGVLTALERAGLPPDVVVGVSTGAVVAATYAAREDWSRALQSVDRGRLPSLAPRPEEDVSLARLRTAFRSAKQLAPSVWTWGRQGYEEYGRATLADLLGDGRRFEDTRVPLAQVATDLSEGRSRVLMEGHLATATLAASTLPGVTRPVEVEGRLLVDGAFTDPAPVDVARGMGADVVLVIHCLGDTTPDEPDNWIMALVRGMEIGQHAFAEERLAQADLVVRPDLGNSVRALDFTGLDNAVRRTATALQERLPELERLLGRPRSESPPPSPERRES